MCKHSTDTVDKLAKRQRGLDARGNDPMATRRESSWAAAFIENPPGDLLASTLTYLNGFQETDGKYAPDRVAPFKQKLALLGPQPKGAVFADFFANGKDTQFKDLIDQVSEPIVKNFKDVEEKGRLTPAFLDRGRIAPGRARRDSIDTSHVGITTSKDRTEDTKNVYGGNYFHAQAQFIARMDSETVKKFRASGAPFIGGASGTIQAIAMEMETRGKKRPEDVVPVSGLDQKELEKREKVLAMLSVQHVAAGHHSMSECLVSAKTYGYFKDIPDPLTDYDGAMAAFERRIASFDPGANMPPLSRETENQDKSKNQVRYEDRLALVKTHRERYDDQLPPEAMQKIKQQMDDAAKEAARGKNASALKKLDKADNLIRGQAALIASRARGNDRVLRPDELTEKMRAASGKSKRATAEYKAAKDALAIYEKSMKELAGRKLNHDRASLAFEDLRSKLKAVENAASAYQLEHGTNPAKAAGCKQMKELADKVKAEAGLLAKAETESNFYDPLGDVTIDQSLEYARVGVRLGTQARPDVLKESRITNKKVLGAGGISTVMLVDYKAEGTHPAEQRAFKPEQAQNTTHTHLMDDLGIDPNQPKFGKRNIASKKMADAAGLGGMIPDAAFATVEGQIGLSMQLAKGAPPVKRVKVEVRNPETDTALDEAIAARKDRNPDWKSKIPEKNRMGMRYGYDDRTGKFTIEEQRATELPFAAPPAKPEDVAALQQQLVQLQWLDALCGQTDRHAENYLVDTSQGTPTVMGIDNDFSFGKKRKDPTARQGAARGFPPVIDRATYNSLKAMKWDDIAKTLGDSPDRKPKEEPEPNNELDQDEIVAAKARFDAVQKQLDDMETNGMVVQDWDQMVNGRTVTDILMKPPGGGDNYFKRDAEYQEFIRQQATDQVPIVE